MQNAAHVPVHLEYNPSWSHLGFNPCEVQKKRTGNSREAKNIAKVGKLDQQQELALGWSIKQEFWTFTNLTGLHAFHLFISFCMQSCQTGKGSELHLIDSTFGHLSLRTAVDVSNLVKNVFKKSCIGYWLMQVLGTCHCEQHLICQTWS